MSDFKPRRCRECGEGTVRLLAKPGRRMPYKTLLALEVPREIPIPTCDNCGNEWIDERTAEALDRVLSTAYAEELHQRLTKALDAIQRAVDVPQRRVEELLGLSPGYLSRLRSGRGDASAQVVSALALIAQDPARRLRELEQLWRPDR